MAEAIKLDGGTEAVQLRVAEQYIGQFGKLVEGSTNLILPANVADVGSMVALAMNVFKQQGGGDATPPAAAAHPRTDVLSRPNHEGTENAKATRSILGTTT